MIDSHAHINAPQFRDDLNAVIQSAIDAGVEKIVCPGYDLETSQRAIDLSNTHDFIFAAVGVHPHDAKNAPKNYLNIIGGMASSKKVIAVGETGLDFFRNFSDKKTQIKRFSEQLELAISLDLPVIVHNRNADLETMKIIENVGNTRGVLHCFSGSQKMADWAFERGFFISLTGIITFSEEHHNLIHKAPKHKICIETDCPWLSPVPNRGKRNEPSNIRFVLEKIAQIWEIDIEETDALTTFNTEQLFPNIID